MIIEIIHRNVLLIVKESEILGTTKASLVPLCVRYNGCRAGGHNVVSPSLWSLCLSGVCVSPMLSTRKGDLICIPPETPVSWN